MNVWKQIALCLAALAVAVLVWAYLYPGAPTVLAGYGLKLPFLAVEEAEAAPAPAVAPAAVVAEAVTRATINDRLVAIGTGQARQSVSVTPYAAGRMNALLVKPGAQVAAGAVIARLDSDLEEIAQDRARIALGDAQAALERVQALLVSKTATAVQVSTAELAVGNAELALRDAALTLERRAVVAPIAGIVGILPVDQGNYVTAQTVIATIDDRSEIRVDFWVPERYSGVVKPGATLVAASIARPNETFEGTVSAVDSRIDQASRTMHVQAGIANPGDALRAGMSFEVTMRFPGESFPAVDPLAVQWGADGAFVWAVRGGKAERTPVKVVQRNTDSVLVDAGLEEGDLVVTQGIHLVRAGSAVELASDEPAEAPAAAADSGT